MHNAVVLRHTLFMYTKDHVGFFSDEHILKLREISQQLDKQIEIEFENQQKENEND
jgi:hypothetical protein